MATKYDQSSATRPVSIRSHTSAFQVHFKHTSSALEMSSVNPPNVFKVLGKDGVFLMARTDTMFNMMAVKDRKLLKAQLAMEVERKSSTSKILG